MDISNRALAVLLVVAIVVSVGGAMVNISKLSELAAIFPFAGITGFGTTGVVNVSLQSTANLNVTQTFVEFGIGYVSTGMSGALLYTDDTQTNWTDVPDLSFNPAPLSIENIGNVNLSVSLVGDKNAAGYLGGGTSPSLGFNASNKDPNSCDGTLAASFTEIADDWSDDNNTQNVCSNLQFLEGANELYIDLKLYVPYDSPTGNKTTTWTFNISQS